MKTFTAEHSGCTSWRSFVFQKILKIYKMVYYPEEMKQFNKFNSGNMFQVSVRIYNF